MKTLRDFTKLLIAISFIIPFSLKAQVQTLDEFKSELESHWDLRDTNYQAYAHEELERFLSDKCREGYQPIDLLKALEMELFTKKVRQEYRELLEALKSYKMSAFEANNEIKIFVDKYFSSSKSTSLVVTGVTHYIYQGQCDGTDILNNLNPIAKSVSHHRFESSVSEQNDLVAKPMKDYLIIDFYQGFSANFSLEDQKSSDGSVLQMATMMPPGLTITMELTGLVVTLFPVEQLVKLAERAK